MLFHKPSGKTHFVNVTTALLLRELLQDPQPLEAIVGLFTPGPMPGGEDDDMVNSVLGLLWHLEYLGLIESA